MRRFKQNTAQADLVRRDPTVGLPLFSGGSKHLSKRAQNLLEAPRSMELATPTRDLSHRALTFDPAILSSKQATVFTALTVLCSKQGDATNEELAHSMGWPINRVVGRVFELRELHWVYLNCKRICRRTGNVVSAWRVSEALMGLPEHQKKE